jgi:hypothetical protein
MIKLLVDQWKLMTAITRGIHEYVCSVFEALIVCAAIFGCIIYLFSLLTTRLEFILVSLFGLIYVLLSLHRLASYGYFYVQLIALNAGIGKLRVLLNDLGSEEYAAQQAVIVKDAKKEHNVKQVVSLYLVIVEILCLYQLLKHVNNTFAEFVKPFVPPSLSSYF